MPVRNRRQSGGDGTTNILGPHEIASAIQDKEEPLMTTDANVTQAAGFLIEAANTDTVYRDLYLRRARELFSATLDESAYRGVKSSEKDIEDLIGRGRSAVLQRNWDQAAQLSAQVESLRQHKAAMSPLTAIGKELYDADAVAFDPFSPGKHLGPQSEAKQPELRNRLLETLAALAKFDPSFGSSYEKRRSYFSGLQLASATGSQKTAQRDRAQTERLAQELRDWKESGMATASVGASAVMTRYESPVDLAVAFAADVITRARELGLAEAQTAPVAEIAAAREAIYAHVWQPTPANPDLEREGVLRAQALAEKNLPGVVASEDLKILAGQFVQQIFINSGGARYL